MKSLWKWFKHPLFWVISPMVIVILALIYFRKKSLVQTAKNVVTGTAEKVLEKTDEVLPSA